MHLMEHKKMSPLAICDELGGRLKQARLNKNITQAKLADTCGLTRRAVINAEQGKTTLENFVTIMGALNLLGKLDLFLPKQLISPIELHKLQGKKRQRSRAPAKKEGSQ